MKRKLEYWINKYSYFIKNSDVLFELYKEYDKYFILTGMQFLSLLDEEKIIFVENYDYQKFLDSVQKEDNNEDKKDLLENEFIENIEFIVHDDIEKEKLIFEKKKFKINKTIELFDILIEKGYEKLEAQNEAIKIMRNFYNSY